MLATLVAAALYAYGSWVEFPIHAFNDMRLSPAFALRLGINPYPPLGGGPLSTWIYGPVGILLNLPATFASNAISALGVAWAVNFATVLLPIAVVIFSTRGTSRTGYVIAFINLGLAVLLTPRVDFLFQVADHAAIGFGILSCWVLAQNAGLTWRAELSAALLVSLAIWSKQSSIFVIPAQLLFLLTSHGYRSVARYILWLTAFTSLALAMFTAAFGLQNLWLNLVLIPGRLPWADFWARTTMNPWSLAIYGFLPLIGVYVASRHDRWPAADSNTGRYLRLSTWVAVSALPFGLASFFKIGGNTNVIHTWAYLLPAVLVAWMTTSRAIASPLSWRAPALLIAVIACRLPDLNYFPMKRYIAHYETAIDLSSKYPGAIWFPQHPLITFFTERKIWHADDGISTRSLAGYGLPSGTELRHYLPGNMQAVAYPSLAGSPATLQLFPEYTEVVKIPFWNLRIRANSLQPDRPNPNQGLGK